MGAVAFFFTGFVIYGLLFSDIWLQELMVNRNLTTTELWQSLSKQEKADAFLSIYPGAQNPLYMLIGFGNALISSAGIGFILSRLKPSSLNSALGITVFVVSCLGLTSLAYDHIYGKLPLTVFWIDAAHQLIGLSLAGGLYHYTAKATEAM